METLRSTESADPSRAKLLTDNEELKWPASNTEIDEPNRHRERKDIEDPRRAKLRRDTEEPR